MKPISSRYLSRTRKERSTCDPGTDSTRSIRRLPGYWRFLVLDSIQRRIKPSYTWQNRVALWEGQDISSFCRRERIIGKLKRASFCGSPEDGPKSEVELSRTVNFTAEETWRGGHYEIEMELGVPSDERLRAALERIWAHTSLKGCVFSRDQEPQTQVRVNPGRQAIAEHLYGV